MPCCHLPVACFWPVCLDNFLAFWLIVCTCDELILFYLFAFGVDNVPPLSCGFSCCSIATLRASVPASKCSCILQIHSVCLQRVVGEVGRGTVCFGMMINEVRVNWCGWWCWWWRYLYFKPAPHHLYLNVCFPYEQHAYLLSVVCCLLCVYHVIALQLSLTLHQLQMPHGALTKQLSNFLLEP